MIMQRMEYKEYIFENSLGVPVVATAHCYNDAMLKAKSLVTDKTTHLKLIDVIPLSETKAQYI